MDLWQLPDSVNLGGKNFCFDPDYRNILEIFHWFQNPNLTDFFKWEICLALFYKETIPEDLVPQAISYFLDFVNMGAPSRPGPRLIDEYEEVRQLALDNGALAFCISGAGPTLLCLSTDDGFDARLAPQLTALKHNWTMFSLPIDHEGTQVSVS